MNYRAGGTEGRPTPRDEWRTPPELFRRLDGEFRFVVDAACRPENQLAPVGLQDALGEVPWSSYGGAVWLNPPYSRLRPWMERAAQEGARVAVVCLVPADTSTRWWNDAVASLASEVRFIVGRLRFLRPDGAEHLTKRGGGGLTIPSAVVVYRPIGGPPRYSYMPRR